MILLQCLGWFGNACFFARFLVQWLASERARTSVAPRSFWVLSLSGALFGGAYSLARHEPVMLAGFAITTCIYARNLCIAYGARSWSRAHPAVLLLAALGGASALVVLEGVDLASQVNDAPLWIAVGLVGQGVFSARFLLQWYASERAGHSHFPRTFWYFSLGGNVCLLAYALHLADPIYIAGFVLGPIVQLRNLMLSHRVRTA